MEEEEAGEGRMRVEVKPGAEEEEEEEEEKNPENERQKQAEQVSDSGLKLLCSVLVPSVDPTAGFGATPICWTPGHRARRSKHLSAHESTHRSAHEQASSRGGSWETGNAGREISFPALHL